MVHVFIVNPVCASTDFTTKLREQLSKIPGLNYYVFTSRSEGYENELAGIIEKAFDGEQLRIYCCGGTGTARNIINGIKDLSHIEFGLIPLSNIGYLNAFGNRQLFLDINRMISGETVHVDYIKVNGEIALNSVSVGLDAYSKKNNELFKGFRTFGKHVPYFLSFWHTILLAPNFQYVVQVGDESYSQACAQIAFANFPILINRFLYSDDRAISDGLATFMLAKPVFNLFRYSRIKKIIYKKGKLKNGEMGLTTGLSDTISIRRIGGHSMWVSIDGELINCVECKAEVVRQGLKLIIPKGVEYEQ